MKIYRLHKKCLLQHDINEVWSFFSDPQNLKIITPAELNFKFISGAEKPEIYPGKIIEYRVHPLLGIPMQWVTEITACCERSYFIDEQRFGPYKFWYHEHRFYQTSDGVIAEDLIHYAMPFSVAGRTLHKIFVARQLQNIFNHRQQKLSEIFKFQELQA